MLRRFMTGLNIRARLLLLCLGVALPLLAIGSFSICKQYQTLKAEAHRATSFQAAITARTLSEWTASQINALAALSHIAEVRSLEIETSRRIFITTLQARSEWIEIALADSQGRTLLSVTEQGEESTGLIARELLDRLKAEKKPVISELMNSPWTGRPCLLALVPISSTKSLYEQKEHDGILIASIEPASIWRVFDGLSENSGTVITIVDNNQRVVTRTLDHEFWQGKDFSQARCVIDAKGKERGSLETIGIADKIPRAYAYDHSPINKWLVIVGVPTKAIYGAAYDWLISMAFLALTAIAISVALACSVTSHFTRAIHGLVKESLSIGKGNFTKRVPVLARDELGMLARAFNEMAELLMHDKEHKAIMQNISNQIRQSLDLDEVLNTTVRELGQHLDASRCCLALLDTHNTPSICDDELVFDYVWCNPSRQGDPLHNKSILITQESVLANILEHGSILSLDILDGSSSTPLFENKEESPDDWKSIRSLIACPIGTKSGCLGMILVHQCDELRIWTASELELVEAVAGQVTVALEHARLYDKTKHMAEQQMLINSIVRSVRSSLDLDTILATVTKELLTALKVDRVQIAQPKSEHPLMITHEYTAFGYASGVGSTMYAENQLDFRPSKTMDGRATIRNTVLGINLDSLTGRSSGVRSNVNASESGQFRYDIGASHELADQSLTLSEPPIAIINDTEKDSRCIPFNTFLQGVQSKSLIAAPLIHENRLVGLLIVHQCSRSRDWKPTDIQLVTAIADQLAMAITHAHLFAQVRHQAITDGLTGLYNHVYFKNRLKDELKLADRKGTACSLVMIDLDKLKFINDNFGHPVGDAAIRAVASVLKTILRSGDTAARYGGEEFAVILPETSLLEAALIANRLCNQIRACNVPGLGQITASLGAASYPKHGQSVQELIEKADIALYKAKNSGRDQVQIYEPDEIEIADFPNEQSILSSEDTGAGLNA